MKIAITRNLIQLQQQCSKQAGGAIGTTALRLLSPSDTSQLNSNRVRCHYQKQQATIVQVRASSGWALSRKNGSAVVHPSLRQRRPLVNGKSVAFHMSDLEPQPEVNGSGCASMTNHANHNTLGERQYESDLIVVLDMDECIIHSQFFSNPAGANVYAHQMARAKQRNGQLNGDEQQQDEVDSFRFSLPDGDIVHVNKRPYLEEFLNAVTDRFETHIFTAAMELYASPLLDILDPDGTKFAKRWYRESCTFDPKSRAFVKNLNALPLLPQNSDSSHYHREQQMRHDLPRVVLIDNNPLSFLSNPSNGILVSSFFDDARDNTLPAVLELLDELDPLVDVRPVLDARFGLKDALAEIRGGATMTERVIRNDSNDADQLEAAPAVAF